MGLKTWMARTGPAMTSDGDIPGERSEGMTASELLLLLENCRF